jgi:hypothetical protein
MLLNQGAKMKPVLIAVALACAALTGCAQLKNPLAEGADAGATGLENQRPYPKSSSDLQLL